MHYFTDGQMARGGGTGTKSWGVGNLDGVLFSGNEPICDLSPSQYAPTEARQAQKDSVVHRIGKGKR